MPDLSSEITLPSPGSAPASVRVRILFAEDGRDNQRLISMHLRSAGAEVVIVENGQLAIEQAKSEHFGAILMDMQMPVLDGFGAVEELRRMGITTPIIALTAYTMLNDRTRCVAGGCNDYLAKPVDRQVLLETINLQLAKCGANYEHLLKVSVNAPVSVAFKSRLSGYPGMSQAIVDFVGGLPSEVDRIVSLLGSGDLETLRGVIHQLRGACGRYGFDMVIHPAEVAEKGIAEAAGVDFVRMQIESMIETIQRIDGYDRSAAKVAGGAIN